ncbi:MULTISPECIES: hypothetical protein [Pedobacter]|uniref:Uncharacterized protein n=1 Tax=Pedobacter alluvionis TaxID=475253 RepID=A0A497Y1W8_9SPHI|nr:MULTISPECIES: hypothetical protein [Pedobacter]QXU40376.1 hypothetical protein KYH19_15345 [Pedobacter sp. D749]RLJ76873.1 hypothetical protein BCL90_1920 [Pedobacter alluvionis]
MKKIEVIDMLKEMPDEFSADELIERILLLQEDDSGLQKISEEQAAQKL